LIVKDLGQRLPGKYAARRGLTKALAHLLEGDTLVVTELSRLGRSLQDLITIVADLRRRNVGAHSENPTKNHRSQLFMQVSGLGRRPSRPANDDRLRSCDLLEREHALSVRRLLPGGHPVLDVGHQCIVGALLSQLQGAIEVGVGSVDLAGVELSPASVMGPAVCHDLGATESG
jgi:Resolvase, N terminal domain